MVSIIVGTGAFDQIDDPSCHSNTDKRNSKRYQRGGIKHESMVRETIILIKKVINMQELMGTGDILGNNLEDYIALKIIPLLILLVK